MKETVLIVLPALITGFAGWIFGRGRRRQEIRSLEMDNVAKAIEIWRTTARQIETKYDTLNREVERLTQSSQRLEADYRKLAEDYRRLHQENDRLRKRIHKLEEENRKLTLTLQKHGKNV